MRDRLIRVSGMHRGRPFCAGMVTRQGKVVHAAPILKRSVGKDVKDVVLSMIGRGWYVLPMQDPLFKP